MKTLSSHPNPLSTSSLNLVEVEHEGADGKVVAEKLDYPLKPHLYDEVKSIGDLGCLLFVASEMGGLLLIQKRSRTQQITALKLGLLK
ncbi:hypothetical protein M5689_005620 [Euphorbia peplus]|nr:hypothetical protein M5689_005620 [Euphorbia peplus]